MINNLEKINSLAREMQSNLLCELASEHGQENVVSVDVGIRIDIIYIPTWEQSMLSLKGESSVTIRNKDITWSNILLDILNYRGKYECALLKPSKILIRGKFYNAIGYRKVDFISEQIDL